MSAGALSQGITKHSICLVIMDGLIISPMTIRYGGYDCIVFSREKQLSQNPTRKSLVKTSPYLFLAESQNSLKIMLLSVSCCYVFRKIRCCNRMLLHAFREWLQWCCYMSLMLSWTAFQMTEVSNIGFITVHGLNEGHIEPSKWLNKCFIWVKKNILTLTHPWRVTCCTCHKAVAK